MSQLTAAQRRALPASAFAGPHRSYPIQDASHARNALARAAQFASSKERKTIESKVRKQFPGMGKPDKARDAKVAMFVGKRKPGEVSDVRSQNPGTKGVEGTPRYPSKAGYQIPYSQDTSRNPYRPGRRG